MNPLTQALISGTMVGSVYVLLAIGMVIVYHTAQVTNIAHGEAYSICGIVVSTVAATGVAPIWAIIPFAIIVSVLFSLAVERFLLRPRRAWSHNSLILVTLAGALFVRGVLYALVICCLRYLRGQSSIWLTLLNQLGSGICLGLGVIIFSGVDEFLAWFTGPTLNQFVFLACFGAVQMGFSYYFFARGLKKLSPQEAGFITLLEPILNPLWVWLAFGETNPISIWIGGAFILFALGWRYSSKT